MTVTWIAPSVSTASERLRAFSQKPWLAWLALAIGLVAGPLLSNAIGWQVSASAAQDQVRAGLIEQRAAYCNAQARTHVAESGGTLDWRVRTELAQRWTPMPGASDNGPDLIRACERKLAMR